MLPDDSEQQALKLFTRYKPAEINYEESVRCAAKHIAYFTTLTERQTQIAGEVADYLEIAARRRETLSFDEMYMLSKKLRDFEQ